MYMIEEWNVVHCRTHDSTALHWPVRPFLTFPLFETQCEDRPKLVCVDWLQKSLRADGRRRALPSYHSAYLDLSQFPTSLWLGSLLSAFLFLSGSKTVRLNPFWLPLTAETHHSSLISKDTVTISQCSFKYIWFHIS